MIRSFDKKLHNIFAFTLASDPNLFCCTSTSGNICMIVNDLNACKQPAPIANMCTSVLTIEHLSIGRATLGFQKY